MFVDEGLSPVQAGLLLSLCGGLSVLGSLVLPVLGGRSIRQHRLVIGRIEHRRDLLRRAARGAGRRGSPEGSLGLALAFFSLRSPD